MEELGLVIRVSNDYATVKIKRNSACGNCKACELGTTNKGEIDIQIKNTLDVMVGDQVKVQMETPDILKAAFTVYMIPMLALLIGVTGTYFITKSLGKINEPLMVLAGFIMLGISLLYVRAKDRAMKETENFEPTMLEKFPYKEPLL